jgi:hypothetical protein
MNFSDSLSSDKHLRVLVLEPYYGGSHKSFLENLTQLPFTFELMTLPARKWKWRMRLAAPYFAERLANSQQRYDRILCSTSPPLSTWPPFGDWRPRGCGAFLS